MNNKWFLSKAGADSENLVFVFSFDEDLIPRLYNALDFSDKNPFTFVEFSLSANDAGLYLIPESMPEPLLDELDRNGYAVLPDMSLIEQWEEIDTTVSLKVNPFLTILTGRVDATGNWVESRDITFLIREITGWRTLQ